MKILTIVGARPQFIKAAVVSRAIADHNKSSEIEINEIIAHTGQHYDQNMSEIFFAEMQIPKPDFNLATGSGSHAEQTGEMIIKLEKSMLDEKPELDKDLQALPYPDLYGSGKAGENIVNELIKWSQNK